MLCKIPYYGTESSRINVSLEEGESVLYWMPGVHAINGPSRFTWSLCIFHCVFSRVQVITPNGTPSLCFPHATCQTATVTTTATSWKTFFCKRSWNEKGSCAVIHWLLHCFKITARTQQRCLEHFLMIKQKLYHKYQRCRNKCIGVC